MHLSALFHKYEQKHSF